MLNHQSSRLFMYDNVKNDYHRHSESRVKTNKTISIEAHWIKMHIFIISASTKGIGFVKQGGILKDLDFQS